MENYYEINVALNEMHFFATAPRSCRNKTDMSRVYNEMKKRFPKNEGYKVTVTHWECVGHDLIDLTEEVGEQK